MGKPLRVRRLSGEVRRLIEQSYGGSLPPPSSIDEVMSRLRALPEYGHGLKHQEFTRVVKQTLDSDKERRSKKPKRIDIGKSSSETMIQDTPKSKKMKPTKNMELELDRQTTKTEVDHHHHHQNLSSCSSNGNENGNEGSSPRLKDIGGIDDGVLKMLKTQVIHPLRDPELLATVGVSPITGILLHGPPGCGKTRLARAIANEAGVPFYKVSSTDLVSGVSGASEESIRELFSKAYATAPSIVFIDEIDAIASKRENLQREMEKRIVTQLMTCMEDTRDDDVKKLGHVLVIAATNRPDALDPALRRPGRFDHEILLDVPDESARVKILSIVARHAKLDADFDPVKISRATC